MQRSTSAILAVFSILALFTIFSFVLIPQLGAHFGEKRSLIPANAGTRTTRIILDDSDSEFPLHFEKTDGHWFLLLGDISRYPARNDRINECIAELASPRSIRNLKSKNGSSYGLTDPSSGATWHQGAQPGSLYLRLAGDDGTIISELEFGSSNADGLMRYVRAGTGRTIMEVADSFSSWFDPAASLWVELALFREPLAGSDIQEVSYSRGTTAKTFIRGKNADVEHISGILGSLRALDITNIPSIPEQTVSLGMGSGKRITFSLAALGEDTAVLTMSRTGAAYIISMKTKEQILGALGIH